MESDDFSIMGQIIHFFQVHGFQIIVTIIAVPVALFIRKLGLSFVNSTEVAVGQGLKKCWNFIKNIPPKNWKMVIAVYSIWLLALLMYSFIFDNLFHSHGWGRGLPPFYILATLPPIFVMASYSLLKWASKKG